MQPPSTGSSTMEQAPSSNASESGSRTVTSPDVPSQSTVRSTHDISNDTSRASTLVCGVIKTAKTAVDDALSWAEKKASTLDLEKENVGPYNSPATCMPSDLDAIANGILPAVPSKSQHDKDTGEQQKEGQGMKAGEESSKRAD